MSRYLLITAFVLGAIFNATAQDNPLETLGITNGSVHMKGSFPYTKFLKKYKGTSDLTIHVWYNASGPMVRAKDIKAGDDEVYFLYGRNRSTGLSEMGFVFGVNAKKAFSKKKDKDLTEFIDFFEFEVFANQNFRGYKARDVLDSTLE